MKAPSPNRSNRKVHHLTLLLCLTLFGTSPITSFAATEFQGTLDSVSITDADGANQPPVAQFTYRKEGDTYIFDASGSSDPDGTIEEYRWEFGDGTTASGSSTSYQLRDGAAEPIIATLTVIDNNSAVSIKQQIVLSSVPVEIIVDNLDTGFSTTGSWFSMSTPTTFFGDNYIASKTDGDTTAKWQTTLPLSQEYDVFLTWQSHSSRSADVVYEIFNNNKLIYSSTIDQKGSPSEFQLLGKFSLQQGAFMIKIFKSEGFTITADALKIVNSN